MEEKNELTFEEAYGKLEAIVEKLEKETNSLESSLKLYQEGKSLSDYCRTLLDRSELTLKNIQENQQ